MILFACAREGALQEIQRYGLRYSGLGHKLYRTLDGARKECGGKILVVELGDADLRRCTAREKHVVAPLVKIDALSNLNPYLAPESVTAAGGLVVRHHRGRHQLVCIHRRGVWDLPKGKLDENETIEECARREVTEELGIDDLRVAGTAGHTRHGYPGRKTYLVKTTHWFWMRTDATVFEPQLAEGIDSAEWMSWDAARKRVGYRTLRDLLAGLDPANIPDPKSSEPEA